MIVDLKFHAQFLQPILSGTKTTTLRRSPKGNCGDYFLIGDRVYQIREIRILEDIYDILELSQVEGFRTEVHMIEWLNDNNYRPPLYLHRFSEIGHAVCFSGSYYLEYDKIPESYLHDPEHDAEVYPGLYYLKDGNILEAHECLDPEWDELVRPFGSIYYDIYDPSAIQE